MKRVYYTILCSFLLCSFASAQLKINKVSTEMIAPGIKYMRYEAPSRPAVLYVIEADVTNEYFSFETWTSNDKVPNPPREILSSFSNRKTYEGHRVAAAANADFFSYEYGVPCGLQAIQGEVIKSVGALYGIGMTEEKKPFLEATQFASSVTSNNVSYKIDAVNVVNFRYYTWYQMLGADRLIMYNHYMDFSRQNETPEVEVLLQPIMEWNIGGDSVKCVVVEKGAFVSKDLSGKKVVLGGFGKGATYIINNISINDTVKIDVNILQNPKKIKELIGVYPRIVVDGKNHAYEGYVEYGKDDAINPSNKNPLTNLGFNKEGTKMYLVVCDGRQEASQGLNLYEMADFMISLGVDMATHFDSGGSTMLCVNNKLENSPSGGSERAIVNAVGFVTSAPSKLGELAHIQVTPDSPYLYRGNSVQLQVKGYDKYYNQININQTLVKFTNKSDLGSISVDGLFTAGMESDTALIECEYNGIKDSASIITKWVSGIRITPEEITTDNVTTAFFHGKSFDIDNASISLPDTCYKWSVADTTIGLITENGVFLGKKNGATTVYATLYGRFVDSAKANVIIVEGSKLLDSFEDEGKWNVSSEYMDVENTKISFITDKATEGTKAIKLDYQYQLVTGQNNIVYLNTDIPVEGIPDSIYLDCLSGTNEKTKATIIVEDAAQKEYKIIFRAYLNNTDKFNRIPAPYDKKVAISGSSSPVVYPISIKQIMIAPPRTGKNDSTTYSGSVIFDRLFITYPNKITDVKEISLVPSEFNLSQNYPNPFNPTTTINYNVAKAGFINIAVYNMLGQRVKTLINSEVNAGYHSVIWNGTNECGKKVASGTYLYRAIIGNQVISKKMLLLK